MGLDRIGDWDRVGLLISKITEVAQESRQLSLKRFGLKLEGIVKTHISTQDLGWTPLKPATISKKVRQGYSENILVETSTYFQSITSWTVGTESGYVATAYVGVKRDARGPKGEVLASIAAVHEMGSTTASIPKRPLWSPSFAEVMAWHIKRNTPEIIFLKKIQKYL